ncbi:HAD domain-containing protein [Wenjunlia tyrosinilytica]|uniref:Secreted protein n=1 Tax=Wenjunlia tyrosinilytica TaxID=1544741 RepID=A0A917ZWG4_9ACTN|nr:HAD domain-containing protein [Wenjunlia tyrosinilytica]GGO93944.1 hypothetical protein GCM10012280_47600 [Wenjunlia tyrosinilytica]
MPRPLLLLDVDGVLNPFAAPPERRPEGYATHRMRPNGWDAPGLKPLRVWLNPAHGPLLLALPYELVWATTWMDEANRWISPQLGLPELPFIAWPEMFAVDENGVHWKTRHLVEYAAGRPFAWVDDELGDPDRAWVAGHHGGEALLHRVDPRIGLTDADFEALDTWARGREPGGDGSRP